MDKLENRDIKSMHCLSVDDLKVYQDGNKILKEMNEITVQVSQNTGACYRLGNCANHEQVRLMRLRLERCFS